MRCFIGKTDVDSVLGNDGGWSGGGGGDAISNEGLEQLPTAALDNEPLCDNVPFDNVLSGLSVGDGVDGDETDEHCPGAARLTEYYYIDTIFNLLYSSLNLITLILLYCLFSIIFRFNCNYFNFTFLFFIKLINYRT